MSWPAVSPLGGAGAGFVPTSGTGALSPPLWVIDLVPLPASIGGWARPQICPPSFAVRERRRTDLGRLGGRTPRPFAWVTNPAGGHG